MNRMRCFLVGAALVAANVLQLPANAQDKQDKEMAPVELRGIRLGDRTVAKGKDWKTQRALFNVHGKPTAVVLPQKLPADSGAKGQSETEDAPDWMQGIVTKLDKDHILWLYRRPKYAMAFRVNREGIIDGITLARTK